MPRQPRPLLSSKLCHSERSNVILSEHVILSAAKNPIRKRPVPARGPAFSVSAFPERKAFCDKTYQTNSKVMSRGMPRLLMCAMSAESASDTFA